MLCVRGLARWVRRLDPGAVRHDSASLLLALVILACGGQQTPAAESVAHGGHRARVSTAREQGPTEREQGRIEREQERQVEPPPVFVGPFSPLLRRVDRFITEVLAGERSEALDLLGRYDLEAHQWLALREGAPRALTVRADAYIVRATIFTGAIQSRQEAARRRNISLHVQWLVRPDEVRVVGLEPGQVGPLLLVSVNPPEWQRPIDPIASDLLRTIHEGTFHGLLPATEHETLLVAAGESVTDVRARFAGLAARFLDPRVTEQTRSGERPRLTPIDVSITGITVIGKDPAGVEWRIELNPNPMIGTEEAVLVVSPIASE